MSKIRNYTEDSKYLKLVQAVEVAADDSIHYNNQEKNGQLKKKSHFFLETLKAIDTKKSDGTKFQGRKNSSKVNGDQQLLSSEGIC